MTPAELGEMLAGASWRYDRERWLVAWQTSHFMNVSGKTLKRTMTPNELLGKPREVVIKDPHAKMKELWRRVEEKREREREAADGSEDRGS